MKKEILHAYVAYCPSCGALLKFNVSKKEVRQRYDVVGRCPQCERRWSFIFDIDPSGTFGVISFQCDNNDRIMKKGT